MSRFGRFIGGSAAIVVLAVVALFGGLSAGSSAPHQASPQAISAVTAACLNCVSAAAV